jgi:hypothetical protein
MHRVRRSGTDGRAAHPGVVPGPPLAAHHRVVSKTVVVGTAKLTLRVGETHTLTVELDRTGRKLLARFKKLPVVLTVTLLVNGKESTVSTRRLELRS